MTINFFRFSLFAWLLTASIFTPMKVVGNEWDGLFRLGALIPTSHYTRKIYRPSWKQYQLEAEYRFSCKWSIWTNLAYSIIDGRHVDSRLQLYPIGLGLKYRHFFANCLEGYLGGGITYSFLHLENDVELEDHRRDGFKIAKKAVGGVIKSGLRYYYYADVFVELFADYYYSQFHVAESDHLFKRNRLDLSAFFLGAGIGAEF